MWAAGAVVGEMLAGRPLFQGRSDIDQLHKILQVWMAAFRSFLFSCSAPASYVCLVFLSTGAACNETLFSRRGFKLKSQEALLSPGRLCYDIRALMDDWLIFAVAYRCLIG